LELTIHDLPEEQLTEPIVTVTGTISDTGYKVWVNGVAATLNGNTWTAHEVPITDGGTAIFAVAAIPLSDNNGNGTPPSGASPDPAARNPGSTGRQAAGGLREKPRQVVITQGRWERHDLVAAMDGGYYAWDYVWRWSNTNGGYAEMTHTEPDLELGEVSSGLGYWQATNGATRFEHWVLAPTNVVATNWVDLGQWFWPGFKVSLPWAKGHWEYLEEDPWALFAYEDKAEDVTLMLRTGGRHGVAKRNLFVVTASAYERLLWYDRPIPFTNIFITGLNRNLGADGRAFAALPDNAEIDITPKAPGGYYTFDVSATKHKLRILANGQDCQTDFFFNRPTFIVGQYVTLSASWDPEPPNVQVETNRWSIAGNYKNDQTNAVPSGSMTQSSDVYFANPNRLTNAAVPNNWWVSGGFDYPASYAVALDKGLTFTNGQHVQIMQNGSINMWRPKATVTATTGTVALDTNYMSAQTCPGVFGLHFGFPSNCGGTPGITSSSSISIPIGFSGTEQWVQVINSFSISFQTNDAPGAWYRWSGANGLDGSYPYSSNPTSAEDSPGVDLTHGNPNCWLAKRLMNTADCDTWLEFRPTGGHWVPLRMAHWSWSGEAILAGTNCLNSDWTGTNFTNTVNPPYADTEEYARWTNIIAPPPTYLPE
jgi:hypothetical protein